MIVTNGEQRTLIRLKFLVKNAACEKGVFKLTIDS